MLPALLATSSLLARPLPIGRGLLFFKKPLPFLVKVFFYLQTETGNVPNGMGAPQLNNKQEDVYDTEEVHGTFRDRFCKNRFDS